MEHISWKPLREEPSHERGTWKISSFISVKIFRLMSSFEQYDDALFPLKEFSNEVI